MEAIMDNGGHSTRGFSRGAVVAMYGSYVVGAAMHLGGGAPAIRYAGVALIVAAYLLFARLATTAYWRPGNAPARALDERELLIRNGVYLRAYGVIAVLPLMAALYTSFALDDGRLAPYLWLPHSYHEASVLFWGWFLLMLTLPAAMLAWTREVFDPSRGC